LVHLTNDGSEELIIRDFTRAISIEDTPSNMNLLLVETHTEVMKSFSELLFIEGLRSVVIGDLEFLTEGRDTSGSSSSNLLLDVLKNTSLSSVGWETGRSCSLFALFGLSGGLSIEDIVVSLSSRLLSAVHGPSLGSKTLTGLLGKSPGVVHHELEVHIIINGDGNVVVVLGELFLGHNVVRGIVVSHGMSCFKSLKEFLKDLLFSLLARNDIGVLGGIVDASDIIDVNPTIVVFVKLGESLHDDSLSLRAHLTTDGSEELVISDLTIVGHIEVVKECGDLSLVEAEHEVVHGLGELVLVKRFGVIIVHDFELSLESDNSAGTTRSKLFLEFLGKRLRVVAATSTAGLSLLYTTKDYGGEFFVVEGT
jgi:hypothetical protein